MKPNSFLDITQEEFKGIYTATRPSTTKSRAAAQKIINKKTKKNKKPQIPTRLL
jgi:hypothetical protein